MTIETPVAIHRVIVDLQRNSLLLQVSPPAGMTRASVVEESAILDIGSKGRLIGLELSSHYFAVAASNDQEDNLVRSTEVAVLVSRAGNATIESIELPRMGGTYEITFPIGNQCWRQNVNGLLVESCVVTVGR